MSRYWGCANMDELVGKTFTAVTQDDDGITFKTEDNAYRLEHHQECCEDVYLDDVAGDLNDLVGTPILLSEETQESGDDLDERPYSTWSFYKFATVKGHVTVKFFGSSNGYYSETADLYKEKRDA